MASLGVACNSPHPVRGVEACIPTTTLAIALPSSTLDRVQAGVFLSCAIFSFPVVLQFWPAMGFALPRTPWQLGLLFESLKMVAMPSMPQ